MPKIGELVHLLDAQDAVPGFPHADFSLNEERTDQLSEEAAEGQRAVEETGSGIDALEVMGNRASENILDMMMPGMDGVGLAQAIQGAPEFGPVHLVMLTSLGMPGTMEELCASGIEVFLSKPVRQAHLYDALLTVLNGADPQGGIPDPGRGPPWLP